MDRGVVWNAIIIIATATATNEPNQKNGFHISSVPPNSTVWISTNSSTTSEMCYEKIKMGANRKEIGHPLVCWQYSWKNDSLKFTCITKNTILVNLIALEGNNTLCSSQDFKIQEQDATKTCPKEIENLHLHTDVPFSCRYEYLNQSFEFVAFELKDIAVMEKPTITKNLNMADGETIECHVNKSRPGEVLEMYVDGKKTETLNATDFNSLRLSWTSLNSNENNVYCQYCNWHQDRCNKSEMFTNTPITTTVSTTIRTSDTASREWTTTAHYDNLPSVGTTLADPSDSEYIKLYLYGAGAVATVVVIGLVIFLIMKCIQRRYSRDQILQRNDREALYPPPGTGGRREAEYSVAVPKNMRRRYQDADPTYEDYCEPYDNMPEPEQPYMDIGSALYVSISEGTNYAVPNEVGIYDDGSYATGSVFAVPTVVKETEYSNTRPMRRFNRRSKCLDDPAAAVQRPKVAPKPKTRQKWVDTNSGYVDMC